MKRDKWFLNFPSKWNMLKGLKNIYDWYLILTFPTAIFLKVHVHYRHELVFFWRFSRPRGGAHYITLNTVATLRNVKPVASALPLFGIVNSEHRPLPFGLTNLDVFAYQRIPPFSINFRCQIENQVSDYRLLGASIFLFFGSAFLLHYQNIMLIYIDVYDL